MNPYQMMYQKLRGAYNPQQQSGGFVNEGYGGEMDPEEEILRRKRRLASPLFQTLANAPIQQQDPGMASDIFKAIGNPLTGMIPGILSAIFKKRS